VLARSDMPASFGIDPACWLARPSAPFKNKATRETSSRGKEKKKHEKGKKTSQYFTCLFRCQLWHESCFNAGMNPHKK
jgi:hypothetical protein